MIDTTLFVIMTLVCWFAVWRWATWKRRYNNLRIIKVNEMTNTLTGIVLGLHGVKCDTPGEWPEQIEDK